MPFLEQILFFIMPEKCIMHTPSFVIQNMKKACTWGQNRLKYNLNCFIIAIFQWNWHYLYCECVVVKNTMTGVVDDITLIHAKELFIVLSCTVLQMPIRWRKQKTSWFKKKKYLCGKILVPHENNFDLMDLFCLTILTVPNTTLWGNCLRGLKALSILYAY